jgi:hypothetical protein
MTTDETAAPDDGTAGRAGPLAFDTVAHLNCRHCPGSLGSIESG